MEYLLESAIWGTAIFVTMLLRWAFLADKRIKELEEKVRQQSVSLSGQKLAVQLLSRKLKEKD